MCDCGSPPEEEECTAQDALLDVEEDCGCGQKEEAVEEDREPEEEDNCGCGNEEYEEGDEDFCEVDFEISNENGADCPMSNPEDCGCEDFDDADFCDAGDSVESTVDCICGDQVSEDNNTKIIDDCQDEQVVVDKSSGETPECPIVPITCESEIGSCPSEEPNIECKDSKKQKFVFYFDKEKQCPPMPESGPECFNCKPKWMEEAPFFTQMYPAPQGVEILPLSVGGRDPERNTNEICSNANCCKCGEKNPKVNASCPIMRPSKCPPETVDESSKRKEQISEGLLSKLTTFLGTLKK